MFRIRRVFGNTLPADRQALAESEKLLRIQIPGLSETDFVAMGDDLAERPRKGFVTVFLVAEAMARGDRVRGFALLKVDTQQHFGYLDYLVSAPGTSGGTGTALYERVREEGMARGLTCILIECLPDDPALSPDPEILKQNRRRLKFYERFGARPLTGTLYETPMRKGDADPPYLVVDPLIDEQKIRGESLQIAVLRLLQHKYGRSAPAGYIDKVVASIAAKKITLRVRRYIKSEQSTTDNSTQRAEDRKILMLVNEKHDIHHVHERGYVESPVRIPRIRAALHETGLFLEANPRRHGDGPISEIHDHGYLRYFRKVCAGLKPGESIYPYVFPVRNRAAPPKELSVRAGYYCIDTFTPLNFNALEAARGAADCALSAAEAVIDGRRIAYALVRPPGHHAEHSTFGGFCYFCNGALAANLLARHGRVAILDIDYHHGNGQQDIFYHRADVLTVSLHGHPSFAYPYFSGFGREKGTGEGEGFNRNFPLAEKLSAVAYLKTVEKALAVVQKFRPTFLVLSLGYDIGKGDPTGTWSLLPADFRGLGSLIGSLHLPTVVLQEGGYRVQTLPHNAKQFFSGLAETGL